MLCASFIFYSFHHYYSRGFLPCVFRPRLSPLILLILYTNTWEGLCVVSQVAPLVASEKSPIPPGEAQMSFSLKMLWEERVARRADCKWVLKSGDPGFRSLLPSLQDVGKQAAALYRCQLPQWWQPPNGMDILSSQFTNGETKTERWITRKWEVRILIQGVWPQSPSFLHNNTSGNNTSVIIFAKIL